MEGAKKKSPSSSRRGLVRVPIRKGPVRQNPVSKSERRIGTGALKNKVLRWLKCSVTDVFLWFVKRYSYLWQDNRTIRVREREEGAVSGVAFICVHGPEIRKGEAGKERCKGGEWKVRCLTLDRDIQANQRGCRPKIGTKRQFFPQVVIILTPGIMSPSAESP